MDAIVTSAMGAVAYVVPTCSVYGAIYSVSCVATGIFTSYSCYKAIQNREALSAVIWKGDPICVRNWIWTGLSGGVVPAESSIIELREDLRKGREKAGYVGPYHPALSQWEAEVVGLIDLNAGPLPTQASSKNELVYNDAIAKAVTDKEMDKMSRNVSRLVTYYLISLNTKIDPSEFLELVAKESDNPQADMILLYNTYCQKKFKWSNAYCLWHSFKYWCVAKPVSKIIQTFFGKALTEIRLTTDGKKQPLFEGLLGQLEKFLQDYRAEKPLGEVADGKTLKQLCAELAPILIDQFVPKVSFFEDSSNWPITGFFFKGLDLSVGRLMNWALKDLVLKKHLPGVLENLSENILLSLTADEAKEEEYPVNYRFAIPVMHFINDKLLGFVSVLKNPSPETDLPTPPHIAKKLEGVISQLMQLSDVQVEDPEIRDQMRDGLIDGGYQLLKYLQKEPEVLLNQLLVLSGLAFSEASENSDMEENKIEYDRLCAKQIRLATAVGDEVFEIEAQKMIIGDPGAKVEYHLTQSHHLLKRYLEEGLSEVIGLKSSLKKAGEDLKNKDYQGFDPVLQKHFLLWEGFSYRLKKATDKHYPEAANKILKKEFYPICEKGKDQIFRTSKLQEEWMLYTRHRALEKNFQRMTSLFEAKDMLLLDFPKFRKVLEETESLLPPNPPEIQMLKRFSERLPLLEKQSLFLKDLAVLKGHFTPFQKNNPKVISSIDALLKKNPRLQDPEFMKLYNKFKEAKGVSENRDIFERLDEFYRINYELLKEEQVNLLHRIHPGKPRSAFNIPLSFSETLKECSQWVLRTQRGYETLKNTNLEFLQRETEALYQQTSLLEEEIQRMEPHKMHFPAESLLLDAKSVFGTIGGIPVVRGKKQCLIKELEGILTGIRPLIMAKKEEGKRNGNLYSWIEKLAMHEIINHFKVKK